MASGRGWTVIYTVVSSRKLMPLISLINCTLLASGKLHKHGYVIESGVSDPICMQGLTLPILN